MRCSNDGFPCRAAASGGQTGYQKHDFVGVWMDFSHSAMSVLSPNVFETVQLITLEFGHFSASRPNLGGPRNPQPVVSLSVYFVGLPERKKAHLSRLTRLFVM